MKIINNNISYVSIKKNSLPRYNSTKTLQTDIFQKSKLTFKGNQDLNKKSDITLPEIKTLPNVRTNFVSNIIKQISKFSPEWLKKFRQEGYKVIITPRFFDAYNSENVFDPVVFYSELTNSKGTLGVTYSKGKNGKNFFAFCDKPPYSDKYTPSIVNHELSHGIVDILGLDKDKKTFEMLKKDVELIIKDKKLDKLTPNERKMISHYFFKQNAYMPVDELCADLIAWNHGYGLYGSGLILDVDNPNLMQGLFPNLSEYLKTVKP